MRYLALVLLLLSGCSSHKVDLTTQAPPTWNSEPGGGESASVDGVVDGDTIIVTVLEHFAGPGLGESDIGGEYRVRLTGIDTPESVRPGTPVECFGREASSAAAALLEGRSVLMVKDVENADRFNRLLRYVYIGEEMANARLVANGYAYSYTYPPNVRHSDLLVKLQREAREHDRGLWAPDTCSGKP